MSLFKSLTPTILKESCALQDQINKLKELLPEMPLSVQRVIDSDISLLEMGLYGENKLIFELKNSHIPMYILHDVFLKHGELTAQIDFLVICQKCTYVIECKNLVGNIAINSRGDFIRTIQTKHGYVKEGIYSPITQNNRHIELMREIFMEDTRRRLANAIFGDIFSSTYIPVVVIANDKAILDAKYAKKEIKDQIIRVDQLISFIREHEEKSRESKRSATEMKASAEKWLTLATESPVDYTEKYRNLEKEFQLTKKPEFEQNESPICPACGAKMVKRIAKTGERKGQSFWGCSAYPKCRQIINIQSDVRC